VTVAIARFMAVTIDAVDARALASFWTALLDTEIEADLGDGQYIFLAGRGGLELCLQRVPEPKASKNRVHLDLAVDDLEVATAHVIELGGTWDGEQRTFERDTWRTMADPQGNEFDLIVES
jgi:predicted enzyme related to lactoylglutathione lyase